MEQKNRFWFDVHGYIDMMHDEFAESGISVTKGELEKAFWDGVENKPLEDSDAKNEALKKVWQKGGRYKGSRRGDRWLQDMSAAWGRWSKQKVGITHGKGIAIVMPGGEMTGGHYVLAECGAASPSHVPFIHYVENQGFPCDIETGRTMAVKNYAADIKAQRECGDMAREYDQRAAENTPIVSFEGIVLNGQLRVMAGMLSARWGLDGMYIDWLRDHCLQYGFTAEDVMKYEHPRLLVVASRQKNHQWSREEFSKMAHAVVAIEGKL